MEGYRSNHSTKMDFLIKLRPPIVSKANHGIRTSSWNASEHFKCSDSKIVRSNQQMKFEEEKLKLKKKLKMKLTYFAGKRCTGPEDCGSGWVCFAGVCIPRV